MVLALVACGRFDPRAAGYPEAVGPDSAVLADGGTDGNQLEVGTVELPKMQADPRLTRKLFGGVVTLIGDRETSCTSPSSPGSDRWCAFARLVLDKTELWVMNISKAATADAVPCDGTSDGCLRLSTDLWTGFQIWGLPHPVAHRFAGETLIFHAGPAPGMRDPYEGAVWAWRPGWKSAEKLTSDKGMFCDAQPGSTAVWCVADATLEQDPDDRFAPPLFRSFDLVAGVLSDPSSAALPRVARLTHAIPGFGWRVRFSGDGTHLAYSTATTSGAPEALQVIKTGDIGKAVPTTILAAVSSWEISHDGKRLYSLQDYDRGLGGLASGTLVAVDFPSGAKVTELKRFVSGFQRIRSFTQGLPDKGSALLVEYADSAAGVRLAALMRDSLVPLDILELDLQGGWFQVTVDLRHTLYMKPVRGNPVAMVARNDGSGACQLTSDGRAETYAERFTDSGKLAIWIEFGRNQSISEEGWYARPEDCGEKTKFGDYVLGYQLVGDDLVVFHGGDAGDLTGWLHYTPLRKSADGVSALPTVIKEHPDITFSVYTDAAGAWIVFSVSAGALSEHGLYIHGPIPLTR